VSVTELPKEATGLSAFLGSFHRYGLPGVVIGIQFLIIAYQLHVSTQTNVQITKAMVETTAALIQVKDAIKEIKEAEK
jgi:hypothetical protein